MRPNKDKILKILLALTLMPLSAFANSYSPPTEDPFYLSNFCLIKKELPPEVKFIFKDAGTAELTAENGNIVLSTPFKEAISFPLKMNPNHLPVAMLLKDKSYYAHSFGFADFALNKNPLAIGYSERGFPGPRGHISVVPNIEVINEKEIASFIEIPMNYYLGNQFVKNKLKVSVKKILENNKEAFETTKIQSESPLPAGLNVKGNKFYDAKKTSMYMAMEFQNSSDVPILFVKEFNQLVEDQSLLVENKFPIYAYSKGKCYELAIDNEKVLSREKGKKAYEDFYNEQAAPLLGLSDNESVKEYINMLKKRDLYEIQPLGYSIEGNGRALKDCGLKFTDFENAFYDKEKRNEIEIIHLGKMAGKSKEITIPQEMTTTIELTFNSAKSKLHLIKKFVLNTDWKPLKDIYKEEAECSPLCPQIFKEHKVNYLKDAKINYPNSPYKDEDLICGMPGENGYEFRPNKYPSREDMFY